MVVDEDPDGDEMPIGPYRILISSSLDLPDSSVEQPA
jgi:hypothetical protein